MAHNRVVPRQMSEIHVMLRNADVASAPLIKLPEGRTVVGRDPTCSVLVADPAVSRFHAELSVEGTSILMRDLGSRNGTFVDSERVDSGGFLGRSDSLRRTGSLCR